MTTHLPSQPLQFIMKLGISNRTKTMVNWLTGQFANKPTHLVVVSQVKDWTTRGLVISPITERPHNIFILKLNLTLTISLSTTECNLLQITFTTIIYFNFKSNVSESWLVRKVTNPRLDWPWVGLSGNCLVTTEISFTSWQQDNVQTN